MVVGCVGQPPRYDLFLTSNQGYLYCWEGNRICVQLALLANLVSMVAGMSCHFFGKSMLLRPVVNGEGNRRSRQIHCHVTVVRDHGTQWTTTLGYQSRTLVVRDSSEQSVARPQTTRPSGQALSGERKCAVSGNALDHSAIRAGPHW